MTILFNTNENLDISKIICPTCGSVGSITKLNMVPENGDYSEFMAGDEKPVSMCMCKACGTKWVNNKGRFSSSQLIAFLYESLLGAVSYVLDTEMCANNSEAKEAKKVRKSLYEVFSFMEEEKIGGELYGGMVSDAQDLLKRDNYSGEYEIDEDEWDIFISPYLILVEALKDCDIMDIIEIYNCWIEALKHHKILHLFGDVSNNIDFTFMPSIDEVADMVVDN